MHRRALSVAAAIALCSSPCAQGAPTGRNIVAGPVVQSPQGLTGTFEVPERATVPPGPGTGGACLVHAEAEHGGQACAIDGDCAVEARAPGSQGYCLAPADAGGDGQRRCWVRPPERPDAPYCRRSPVSPVPRGTRFTVPAGVDGQVRPVSDPAPGWWRVHACLNLAAQACGTPGDARRATDDGPPLRVPARSADASGARLDTIVVTARHRDEVLQDTPMSITALDADELASRGADDLAALSTAVPNATLYAARPFNNAIAAYIRGVGQSETVWGVEPGVGVYVDDVYLARPQSALLDVLDVERIEVLRGPQGTLYGRNTIGGAIRYITRAPDAAFSGSLGLTVGSHGRLDTRIVANMPVSERLRTRLALARFGRDGYGSNLFSGAPVSGRDAAIARLSADWILHDALDLRLAWDRYVDDSGPRGQRRLIVNRADPALTPPDPGEHDVRSGAPPLDQADATGASATLDWHPGGAWSLKSISAWRRSDGHAYVDFDLLPQPISDLERRLHERQRSQEFQLRAGSDAWQGTGGLYLFDGEAGGTVRNIRSQTWMQSSGLVATRSVAVYGDATWNVGAHWSVEAGLRYTDERKSAVVLNQGYTDAGFSTPNGMVAADFSAAETFRSWSPRLNVAWRPTQGAMLYAQVSRGFRAGGYNIRANTRAVPESALPFRDEVVLSYEAGAKGSWKDGRLTANAALFHNRHRDIQLSVFTSYDSNGDGIRDAFFGDFRNAGAGTSQGAELEVAVRTGPMLRWMAHAGYLDSRYDEYISGGVDIADSQRFTNAPRWTAGASVVADLPRADGSALQARLDGSYRSLSWPTGDLSPLLAQPGHALWNASLAWQSPAKRWRLRLAVANLGDKSYRVTGYSIPVLGIASAYYGAPRSLSLDVGYDFR